MRHQALFSSKDESKNNKSVSAAILLGALRAKKGFLRTRDLYNYYVLGPQEFSFSQGSYQIHRIC